MPPPDTADDPSSKTLATETLATEILATEILATELLDIDWYKTRYSDIAVANIDPLQHFIRHGIAERRDPNRFFDSAWYIEHYPDVAASGLHPLTHYMQAGATERRNPHPRFDAAYYVDQHPDAAANPLLYHLRTGMARGYLTEAAIDIRDYLPTKDPPWPLPPRVFADVIILIRHGLEATRRCLVSVMADRRFPLARIIVIDDASAEPALIDWLQELACDGQIHLLRHPRHLDFAASIALGIEAAETHDAVFLSTAAQVPHGWLHRLAGLAYAKPDTASVSALQCSDDDLAAFGVTLEQMDRVCQAVNARRSETIQDTDRHCVYIRRAALSINASGPEQRGRTAFFRYIAAAGWQHRLACDTLVYHNEQTSGITGETASRFAVTAGLLRQSDLPVILMVTHDFGGGVRRHIDALVNRYHAAARILLLAASDRGAALSVPLLPNHPVLTLPADRLDDLVTLLRSMNVRRVHIHHLLRMDMDIQTLIHRLGVPFDVTVHDYFAICPQINLLRWPEGFYCGEPQPAECNRCIVDQSSHGARDITSWRRGWAWQFTDADRVICPSADVKTRLTRYGMAERAVIVPHEQQENPYWLSSRPHCPAPPLRIVLLGVLANHKGARIVAEVAEAAAPGTIDLYLAGFREASFPKPAARLIKATGAYQDRDLSGMLRRINPHVFWFPSTAPETYSYTLSTAIATGLPIVASDFGSFKERLLGRPLTWLVDHRASSSDWLRIFEAVRIALGTYRGNPPPAPRALTSSDFYAEQYLSPMLNNETDDRAGRKKTVQVKAASRRRIRTPRIAIVPERYNTGGLTPCAYIRLLQPLDHLAARGRFDIIMASAETIFDYDVDIIVTQRHAISDLGSAKRLAEHACRSGAKLLFDLDDDLLDIPVTHPDARKLRPLAATVRRMLRIADTVWVSTCGLAERLAPIRGDVVVIENRLDPRIWTRASAATTFQDDPVRILCMGTSTHDRDFAMIEPALLRLKAEYGDRVAIDIVGMTSRNELPSGLNRVGPPAQASRSYPGFVNWLTTVQPGWHIGLAPLRDTAFNRGKSPIKAMDYAALGLAVIASDTPVYRGSLADGPAGQLVANDHRAWYAALDWLIRDQDLRRTTAIRAHQAFLTQATLTSHEAVWRAALEDLLPAACGGTRAG